MNSRSDIRELSRRTFGTIILGGAVAVSQATSTRLKAEVQTSALPSWRESAAKRTILEFLEATTRTRSPDFVAATERTAVFDNDGTLWVEQPQIPEVAFALARVREMAPDHPEWEQQEPFRSALSGDAAALAKGGIPAMVKLAVATQGGTTPEHFRALVTAWLREARHPRFKRPYGELVYQPMLEVLGLFVAHGFQCFVVSASGLEFLRAWTSQSYGLPPDRVIGSTLELKYTVENGTADLQQLMKIGSLTDGPRKPAAIADIVGQRPLAAFGNSDGDYEMLQYVTMGRGRRLGMLVHHDDAEREYAYDRAAKIGKLDRALDDAPRNNWALISMKEDWQRIFRA